MYESASTGTRTDCLAKNAVIVDKYAVKAAVLLAEMPLVKRRSYRHIEIMRFGLVTLLSLGVCASAIATPWDIVPVETSLQTAESKAAISSHTITMQRGGSSETLETIDSSVSDEPPRCIVMV